MAYMALVIVKLLPWHHASDPMTISFLFQTFDWLLKLRLSQVDKCFQAFVYNTGDEALFLISLNEEFAIFNLRKVAATLSKRTFVRAVSHYR